MTVRRGFIIAMAGLCLALFSRTIRAEDAAGPSVRENLVGIWRTTKPVRMMERQGGTGPCTLTLKADGKYVLAAQVTGKKSLAREYGFWKADGGKMYLTRSAFQWNQDPLEKFKDSKPSPVDYALKGGKLFIMDFVEMVPQNAKPAK